MPLFIPHDALPALAEYRYASEDRSLTTRYILKPFWLRFVHVFPLSMAPNMVTLLGLLYIVVSVALVFIYDPDYKTESPQWLYFYHAFAVFMYQTFDACDGIHARRTGQSSPLGELFDHCCDSINTTLMVIQFASVAGLGLCPSPLIFLVQFAALANFYLSTWEEYYTHKLFLSEISGPVEGLLMISAVFILTGIYGVEAMWQNPIFTLTNGYDITPTHITAIVGALVMAFNIYSARRNVITTLTSSKRSKELPGAMSALSPFFTYYLSFTILAILHPSILSNYTTCTLLTIGSSVSFSVGRIITAHLTKQSFPYVNLPFFIPLFQAMGMEILVKGLNWSYVDALSCVVYTSLGGSIMLYAVFIAEIIGDITGYLDIYALSIKHKKVN